MDVFSVPFERESQLCTNLAIDQGRLVTNDQKDYLPGYPLISLDDGELVPFADRDLSTPLLDQMSFWLWLVATPKSTHVAALHAQLVRGRKIVITEDPEMHLVWISDRVFVKPLPPYLLSYAFWAHMFSSAEKLSDDERQHRQEVLRAALGYVRTYAHLIKHESDFRIAKREYLVPQNLELEEWMAFIKDFRYIEDRQVSGRYHYGDLRLTRLNFWVKPLLRRWYFRKATWQYGEYFAKYFAPLLFVFGMWSLILDSMQVGLQARPSWQGFSDASVWFSVASLVGVVAIASFLAGGLCILAGREIFYAFRKQIRKGRQPRYPSRQSQKTQRQEEP